jgi:voltage-gated potassium channel
MTYTPTKTVTADQKTDILHLVVLILSTYVLVALLVDSLVELPSETSRLLEYIDNVVCIFFISEFCFRFYRANNKWAFMKWGWIDLIASIPALPVLRSGRLIRIFRIIRILRAFRSTRHLVHFVFQSRVKGMMTSAVMISALMVIFSSIAILQVEKDPASNIKTAEDAVWWAYVTITTVGYGDRYPVTTEGRIIAAALMTTGVGLFGVFTAYVASLFVNKKD